MTTRPIRALIPLTAVFLACADPSQPTDHLQIYETCLEPEWDRCLDTAWMVTLPDNPSAAISSACNAMLSAISSCGYAPSLTSADCTRYAAVDLDSDASMFSCVAQLDCTAMADTTQFEACFNTPPSTFGDDLCARIAQPCPANSCSSTMQSNYDMDGATARQDALDAASVCLAQASCDDMSACLAAWRSAVE
jgi:hypothetical protein